MSEILLALATAITGLLGAAAGPLEGGLPIVALIVAIAVTATRLPAAARADRQAGEHRG